MVRPIDSQDMCENAAVFDQKACTVDAGPDSLHTLIWEDAR